MGTNMEDTTMKMVAFLLTEALNAFEQDFQLTRNQPDTQSRTELRA
jgi:hypothetical protein